MGKKKIFSCITPSLPHVTAGSRIKVVIFNKEWILCCGVLFVGMHYSSVETTVSQAAVVGLFQWDGSRFRLKKSAG